MIVCRKVISFANKSEVVDSLRKRLIHDLKTVVLLYHGDVYCDDFELLLKPYSKVYFGNYRPWCKRITLYIYQDPAEKYLQSYTKLLSTFIHEYIHHYQHQQPDFIRLKGVMHDSQFWEKYNTYISLAKYFGLLEVVK